MNDTPSTEPLPDILSDYKVLDLMNRLEELALCLSPDTPCPDMPESRLPASPWR